MRLLTAILGLGLTVAASSAATPVSSYSHLYEGLSFDMPVIDKPSFPDRSVRLTDFGAIADGKTLNTQAFAKATDALGSPARLNSSQI